MIAIAKEIAMLAAAAGMLACDNGAAPSGMAQSFDFSIGAQGWEAAFADYPQGQEAFFELQSGHQPLPAPLGPGRSGLFISGNNHSDDLFMFFKRRITGLQPRTDYEARFMVEFATDVPRGCGGIGGAPEESVYVKAGASAEEPLPEPDSSGTMVLNVDKGNQAAGGTAAVVLGTIENSRPCDLANRRWELKSLASDAGVAVATDESAAAWIFFGTDSGFEGTTTLYYTQIRIDLVPRR
jgi:hypothetical protein